LLVYSCHSAVLSMTSKENFVATGHCQPRITIFDPRTDAYVMEIQTNQYVIFDMCLVEDNYLVSILQICIIIK